MQRLWTTVGLVTVLAVAGVSCDKIKPPQPELQQPPATSGQSGQQEAERTEFSQAAQKELDEMRAVIAELKARAEAASAQTKARLGEEVEKLEAELRAAQQQLSALKSATTEAGKQLKETFVKSLEKLKSGIDSLRKNAA